MKFPCTLKNTLLIIRDRFGLSFASKGLGYLAALFFTIIVTCSLQIILLSNYSATYNFSTCRHYLTENYLSFLSAPRWVRHSYLLKRATIDPLYLWVIRGSRGHGATITGVLVRYFFRSWKAASASGVHSNGPFFFISLKKGKVRSPNLEMKRPNAVT